MMRAEASLSPVSMDSFFTPSRCSFSRDDFAFSRGTSRSTMRAASLPSIATYAAISSGSRGANSEFTSGFLEAPAAVPVAESPTALSATAPAAVPAATPAPSTCVKPASSAVTYAKRPTRTACPFTSPDTPLPDCFLDVLHHGVIASMPRQIAFGAQPLPVLIARVQLLHGLLPGRRDALRQNIAPSSLPPRRPSSECGSRRTASCFRTASRRARPAAA